MNDRDGGELKMFEAVFAEYREPQCRFVAIRFHIKDKRDAPETAEDVALLEGSELLFTCQGSTAIGVDGCTSRLSLILEPLV